MPLANGLNPAISPRRGCGNSKKWLGGMVLSGVWQCKPEEPLFGGREHVLDLGYSSVRHEALRDRWNDSLRSYVI